MKMNLVMALYYQQKHKKDISERKMSKDNVQLEKNAKEVKSKNVEKDKVEQLDKLDKLDKFEEFLLIM